MNKAKSGFKNPYLHILLILLIGVQTLISCSSDDDDDVDTTPTPLEGTWQNASGGDTFVFTGNAFVYQHDRSPTIFMGGTFSVSGSTITFTKSDSKKQSGNFQLSGESLTLSNFSRYGLVFSGYVNGIYTKLH